MTESNLNIVLTNAACCVSKKALQVSNLLSIGNKCAYNEVLNLKLANDYIKVLSCYKFDNYNEFSLILSGSTTVSYFDSITISGQYYYCILEGVSYSKEGNGTSTVFELFKELFLNTSPDIIDIVYEYTEDYTVIKLITNCNINTIAYVDTVYFSENQIFLKNINGDCIVKNCLTEENFNIIVTKLMKYCDICECQLT